MEKPGNEQNGTIHDWCINWFDVNGMLGFVVLVVLGEEAQAVSVATKAAKLTAIC